MKWTFVWCVLGVFMAASLSWAKVVPEEVNCKVESLYGYRADGQPGRIVSVELKGRELKGPVTIAVVTQRATEKNTYNVDAKGSSKINVLLPTTVPTNETSVVELSIQTDVNEVKKRLEVTPMRHWTVYLYNHSHVDVGYTNTHRNVETLHKNNVLEGMKLGAETRSLGEGARSVWNPEVTWPVERLWKTQPEKRNEIITAIKDGRLALDASYLNLNTSVCLDEELFHVFRFSREMQRLSGVPIDVFQQFDIPGMTWGLIPVMVQEGVRYIISWPNSDRGGHVHRGLNGRPFWWLGPDGKSKVLFFQPGKYANSGSMGKGQETGRPWFGQRDPSKVPLRIQTGHANVNFTRQLETLEKSEDYPYDFAVFSWSLFDNAPLDADVPYAVEEWNKTYAYPKIRICGGHEIMSMIERKYGDRLPTVSGDFTEYWTDGLGTAAALTAMNRNTKELLSQAETVWSMLAKGKKAPRNEFDEAWRYILLASEHTWTFENPFDPFFQDAIWKEKQAYFHAAKERAIMAMGEAVAPATDKSNGAWGPREGPSKGGITVLNTHTWAHDGIVKLSPVESRLGDRVVSDSGKIMLSQRMANGELWFLTDAVPSLGAAHYRVTQGEAPKEGVCKIQGNTLENEFLKVTLDPKSGNITSLQKQGDAYNYIDEKVDGGANSFAWMPANKNLPQADTVEPITIVERGPLIAELRIDSKAPGCRSLSRSVRLVAGQPWVEIENVVDKLPLLEKDGIHFSFGFNVPNATTRVDIPWGVYEVERQQWPQANRNWLTLQRWLDVSNATHGVTWCSLDAPLFEYGDRFANIAMGWGNKGPWQTALKPSSTIYSWVMNNHWHTNFPTTQEGPVRFRYRLWPHNAFDIVQANRFGLEQAQPLVHVTADKAPNLSPILTIDNPKVYATILKSTNKDNALIVRLRSLSAKAETVSLAFPAHQPKQVNLCETEEIPTKELPSAFTILPYGQMTLSLKFGE